MIRVRESTRTVGIVTVVTNEYIFRKNSKTEMRSAHTARSGTYSSIGTDSHSDGSSGGTIRRRSKSK
jgi:hypothetical protein